MANTFLTISMITQEALVILKNNLTATRQVNRKYDASFGVEGAKIGTVLNIRKPVRYVVKSGPALDVQDVTETSVPLAITNQNHIDLNFTTADLKLQMDEFSKRFISPAIASLANVVDYNVLQNFLQVYNNVGTPGTVPTDLGTYLNAGVVLKNNATPMDANWAMCLNPQMEATIVNNLKTLFQSSTQIKEQYEKGKMGIAAGFNWYMDQNIGVQTIGNCVGTPLVNLGGQTGSSINLKGWTASVATLNVGDILQFAGCYQANPQNHQSSGRLQDFVVTQPVTADSSTNMTVQISPSIVTSGAYQTVSASPIDGAAVTVYGVGASGLAALAKTTTPQAMAWHPDAFTLATVDLPMPQGVDMGARAADPDLGLSLRIVRAYNINTDQLPTRCDILYGTTAIRPELACRINS